MKKTVISCLVGLLCVSAIVIVVLRHDGASSKADIDPGDRDEVSSRNPGKKFSVTPASSQRKRHKVANPSKPVLDLGVDDDDDEEDRRTPAEKALAERIEKALDEEDLEMAVSCADEALSCAVTEIRQAMVETLGWFGEKALPELTPFLADADEDVRDSAMNEWTTALSSIEDEKAKIGVVELAMGVLKDEDALESISSEYIGVDEKLAVESLSRIITDGKSAAGVEKAKETYEFVTGDEWAGVDEAARWIAEEYEPPNQADASGGNQR